MLSQKLLQQKDVTQVTTISRTDIYRRIKAGTFPAPIKLSDRRVAWLESDVQGWIESRRAA